MALQEDRDWRASNREFLENIYKGRGEAAYKKLENQWKIAYGRQSTKEAVIAQAHRDRREANRIYKAEWRKKKRQQEIAAQK